MNKKDIMLVKKILEDLVSQGKDFECYFKSNGQLQKDFERGEWYDRYDIILFLKNFFSWSRRECGR